MIRGFVPSRPLNWRVSIIPNRKWNIPTVVAYNMSSNQPLSPSLTRSGGIVQPDMNMIARRFLHGHKNSSDEKPSGKILGMVGALLGLMGGGLLYSATNEKDFMCVAHCAGDDDGPCIEKKCEDSPCLRKNECLEKIIMKANADLEKALKETKGKAMEYTEAAMKAFCEAIKVVQDYLDQGYCIIDNDELESPAYEEVWCCLYQLAKKRCEKVKDAITKGQCAWTLLSRLREVVEAGKSCQYTSCNPLLVTAEESLICAERELLNLKSRLDCVSSEHELVELFKETMCDFRKELKEDLDSCPEEEKCSVQYVEQEIALMMEQAYKKVVRVHKELAQVLICQDRVPEKQQETMC